MLAGGVLASARATDCAGKRAFGNRVAASPKLAPDPLGGYCGDAGSAGAVTAGQDSLAAWLAGLAAWLAGLAAWLAGWLGSLAGWLAGLAQGTAGSPRQRPLRDAVPFGAHFLENELICVCAAPFTLLVGPEQSVCGALG